MIIRFSSLKKRDAKRKIAEGDDADKTEKAKTDEIDAKSDAENDTDKKKATKKSTESGNEIDDSKEADSVDAAEADITAEGDEMLVDKSSDAEDDESKKDDDKRKKFVRLYCMHCRIESATFKVIPLP